VSVVVVTVSAMHEQMQGRTEQQQDVRQRAEEVGSVLLPQEEHRDRSEGARDEPEQAPSRGV
jgi:hypothetical protein